MKRAINLVAALLLAASCATAPAPTTTSAPAAPLSNRERLHVVSDVATYEKEVAADPDKQLVDLSTLGIPLDLRYATDLNFTRTKLYPVAKAYARAPVARALVDVQKELAPQGIGLKIWDAYRPYSVTEKMWELIKNPDWVADPAQGSRHNRGAAVDVTLVFLNPGDILAMPTFFDDFTPRARHDFDKLPPRAKAQRDLLRAMMEKHGFTALPSEWWHYDFKGWEKFELLDLPLDQIPSH